MNRITLFLGYPTCGHVQGEGEVMRWLGCMAPSLVGLGFEVSGERGCWEAAAMFYCFELYVSSCLCGVALLKHI